MKVTYGADPEFFVQEIKTGNIVPACKRFGGTKKNPEPLTPDGGYLEDGVAIELNVRPQTTIKALVAKLSELIVAFQVKFPEYLLVPSKAEHHFGDRVLRQFPTAMEIGCDADFWFYGVRKKPQVNEMRGRRFTGGHLHFGFEGLPDEWTAEAMIPLLDLYLMGPSLRCQNAKRWVFYGHPGLYRLPEYGIEYRSLDNWWVTPDGHPLAAIGAQAVYKTIVGGWEKDLDVLFTKIDKYPTKVKENLEYLFTTSFNLGPYLSSKKALLEPAFVGHLKEYRQHVHTYLTKI